MLAYLFTVPSL